MFPSLKVRLSGLEEDVPYIVYVDMDPVDDKRYRYIYQRYVSNNKTCNEIPTAIYILNYR